MTIFLASLFLLASPHCTTSQIVRVYTLELNVGNEDIDVEFGADDDFPAIARHLVATEKLEAGEGCSSTDCVVDVLVSMMQRKTESGTGRSGVLNKVHAVYGRATEHFLREQAKENRQRSETHYRSTHGLNSRDRGGVTAGTGHFASVPCVPPFCSFECAAFPLDSSELDALASTPSPPSSGGFSPIDDVFGAANWPPKPRECPGVFQSNHTRHSEQSAERRAPQRSLFPIRPIWIAVPEERVVWCVPRKGHAFANHVRNRTARSFEFGAGLEEEHLYHRSYRRSYFGTTRKKSGWDALRHVEILAAGSVPWFTNFDVVQGSNSTEQGPNSSSWTITGALLPPAQVLSHLPTRMLARYQQWLTQDGGSGSLVVPPAAHGSHGAVRGGRASSEVGDLGQGAIDFLRFDSDEYLRVAAALLGHTRRRLTTRSLARYILDSTGHGHIYVGDGSSSSGGQRSGRVLMLCGHGGEDYVRDMALHGFQRLLGSRFVDFVRPHHLYKLQEFGHTDDGGDGAEAPGEVVARRRLYGMGYTYAHHLIDDDGSGGGGGDDCPHTLVARDEFAPSRCGYFVDRSEAAIRRHLAEGPGAFFDLVIYGSVHRGRPLWDDVLASGFAPDHVVFVDGEDEFGEWSELHTALRQFGHLFVREVPEGCPPAIAPRCCDDQAAARLLLNAIVESSQVPTPHTNTK